MNEQKVVVEKSDEEGNVIKDYDFEVTLSENDDKTANFTVND